MLTNVTKRASIYLASNIMMVVYKIHVPPISYTIPTLPFSVVL